MSYNKKNSLVIFLVFSFLFCLFLSIPTLAATKTTVKKATSNYNPVAVAKQKNLWWKNYKVVPKTKTETLEQQEEEREKAMMSSIASSTIEVTSTIVSLTNDTVVQDKEFNNSNGTQDLSITTEVPSDTVKFSSFLKFGSVGSEVKELQQKLKDKGFYSSSITDNFGKLTVIALKKYQKNNGIQQTGSTGPLTRKSLNK